MVVVAGPPRVAHRQSRGRRRVAAALVTACLVGALTASAGGVAARAAEDDRDAVVDRQQESASRVEELRNQLTDIDESLSKVYLELEDLKQRIPVAEQELADAEADFDTATREHELALDQLESAQAESDRLGAEIEDAEDAQATASEALAALARQMYRGDTSASPAVVALSSEGVGDIAERAAAAEAMVRAQNRTLSDALDAEVVRRNQAERQDAVTTRISGLEDAARQAEQDAQAAQETAQSKVEELTETRAKAEVAEKEWAAQKKTATKQLDAWQAEYDAQVKKLQTIDAANRAAGTVYATDGGMFTAPLAGSLTLTSSYGYRLHPVLGVYKLHNGTDFAGACGTPTYPIAPGVVAAVTVEAAGGNVVYINHGMINGHSWMSAHVHLQRVDVSVGRHVDRSTVVGQVGATGYATGCHLHLSLMRDGVTVDPMDYL